MYYVPQFRGGFNKLDKKSNIMFACPVIQILIRRHSLADQIEPARADVFASATVWRSGLELPFGVSGAAIVKLFFGDDLDCHTPVHKG